MLSEILPLGTTRCFFVYKHCENSATCGPEVDSRSLFKTAARRLVQSLSQETSRQVQSNKQPTVNIFT